jgi:hypothetical protein
VKWFVISFFVLGAALWIYLTFIEPHGSNPLVGSRPTNDESIEYKFAVCGGQIAYLVGWTLEHKIGTDNDRSTYDSIASWFVTHNNKLNIDKNTATRGFATGMQMFEDNLMRYQSTPSAFFATYYRPMIFSCQQTAEYLFTNDQDIAAKWDILLELATKF